MDLVLRFKSNIRKAVQSCEKGASNQLNKKATSDVAAQRRGAAYQTKALMLTSTELFGEV